jgi:hypothetical protein
MIMGTNKPNSTVTDHARWNHEHELPDLSGTPQTGCLGTNHP